MGKTGIKVLCYNWMQSSDWSRTSTTVEERGGSLVSAFDLDAPVMDAGGQVWLRESD
jgi:D-mannonate dehydratase